MNGHRKGSHDDNTRICAQKQAAPGYDTAGTGVVTRRKEKQDGKKNNLALINFENAIRRAGLDEKWSKTALRRFKQALPAWMGLISRSRLPAAMRKQFAELIMMRAERLGL